MKAIKKRIKRKKVRVLIIGGGGREHAFAWQAAKSPLVEKIYCATDNAGINELAENLKIDNVNDFEKLKEKILEYGIDLILVGPEEPSVNGIVDFVRNDKQLQEKKVKIFGPTKAAAILEGSKVFTKLFCRRHNILTADFVVSSGTKEVRDYLDVLAIRFGGYPIVLKLDGLEAGKGVRVCKNEKEALAFLAEIDNGDFNNTSGKIIVEECLVGEEASFMIIVDRKGHIAIMPSSQDHKRVGDGDTGLNTGGMGAYSKAPVVTKRIQKLILEMMVKTLTGMKKEGRKFSGFLYAGVMILNGIPYLLEYNVRMGDPETQVILPRLKTDFIAVILAALQGNLDKINVRWDRRVCMTVVMATIGYPGKEYKQNTGFEIKGIREAEKTGAIVFHAGTRKDENGKIVNFGTRVLDVTGFGKNYREAQKNVYRAIRKIKCKKLFYRKDIGWRAIAREKAA